MQDIINGLFETSGGIFISASIFKLHKDKKVRGIHWIQVCFFTIWGYWNLYYYPHLEQWFSFWGGMGICITQTIWFIQLMYYTLKEKNAFHR